MGSVVLFPGHKLHPRDDDLAHCSVCGGAEGTLTQDCPHRRMTDEEAEAVYQGTLDFRHGEWTVWTREREMRARGLLE